MKILIVLLSLIMIGCTGSHGSIRINNKNYSTEVSYKVVKIDRCEYIFVQPPSRRGLQVIHKENCNNPYHKEK